MSNPVEHIVLFDGVCNFCNSSVQFIIKRDPAKKFHFASLQSDTGQALLEKYGLLKSDIDSVVYIRKDKAFVKSDAALRIAAGLNGPVRLMAAFRIVPRFIRDVVYDFIAANRYAWFGRREYCMIPSKEQQSRFLS